MSSIIPDIQPGSKVNADLDMNGFGIINASSVQATGDLSIANVTSTGDIQCLSFVSSGNASLNTATVADQLTTNLMYATSLDVTDYLTANDITVANGVECQSLSAPTLVSTKVVQTPSNQPLSLNSNATGGSSNITLSSNLLASSTTSMSLQAVDSLNMVTAGIIGARTDTSNATLYLEKAAGKASMTGANSVSLAARVGGELTLAASGATSVSGSQSVAVSAGGVQGILVNSSGQVGVGKTPAERLDVNGNVSASGSLIAPTVKAVGGAPDFRHKRGHHGGYIR